MGEIVELSQHEYQVTAFEWDGFKI
jgi:hypothetical protein